MSRYTAEDFRAAAKREAELETKFPGVYQHVKKEQDELVAMLEQAATQAESLPQTTPEQETQFQEILDNTSEDDFQRMSEVYMQVGQREREMGHGHQASAAATIVVMMAAAAKQKRKLDEMLATQAAGEAVAWLLHWGDGGLSSVTTDKTAMESFLRTNHTDCYVTPLFTHPQQGTEAWAVFGPDDSPRYIEFSEEEAWQVASRALDETDDYLKWEKYTCHPVLIVKR